MKRRKFITKALNAGVLTTTALGFSGINFVFGKSHREVTAPDYDLVAVMGGEPEVMFDRAIQSVGGMGKFVTSGQNVVLKPNIGWDATPERAANTNPKLVKRIIEHCLQAGAKNVYVFDHTCDNWTKCYVSSGIEKYVKDAGGKMVSGATESYYQNVDHPQSSVLKSAKVHELILESDVFINVPILKSHSSTKLTISMKNLMGVVWDRRFWHSNNLHQCIAEFPFYRKPDLNIVDAYSILKRNGPRGVSTADVDNVKSLLLSTDMVAIDAAATKIFGMDPASIPYIQKASDLQLGTMDLSKLNINRIKI